MTAEWKDIEAAFDVGRAKVYSHEDEDGGLTTETDLMLALGIVFGFLVGAGIVGVLFAQLVIHFGWWKSIAGSFFGVWVLSKWLARP